MVSLGGVSECESIKTAGAAYDDAIIRHIRRRYNVLVGEKTAEELKMAIGSVVPRPETPGGGGKGPRPGHGPAQDREGLLRRAAEALMEPTRTYSRAYTWCWSAHRRAGERHLQNGIIMSGGGSLIYGIDPPGGARHRHPHRGRGRPRLLRGLRRGQDAQPPERHERRHGELRAQAYAARLKAKCARGDDASTGAFYTGEGRPAVPFFISRRGGALSPRAFRGTRRRRQRADGGDDLGPVGAGRSCRARRPRCA